MKPALAKGQHDLGEDDSTPGPLPTPQTSNIYRIGMAKAMGLSPEQSRGLIRFSFGFASTQQDVDRILEMVPRLVAQVRRKAISGLAG